MNLEKRIKRHITGARLDLFAVTLPGCEAICRQEIAKLSPSVVPGPIVKGGVAFGARFIDVCRANLHLRTAGRILVRLASFKASNFHRLQQKTAAVAWSLWLPSGALPTCHVTARRSRLYHSGAIAQRIRQEVADHWLRMGISPTDRTDQAIYVRLQDDRVMLSLDSSGDHLYRRGLKTHGARAPLRETTAAVILSLAGYRSDRPLVDPMCGSGTFSLEAAMMAKKMAPGLQRQFAFMRWPAFRPRQWAHLCQRAMEKIRGFERPAIFASDINATACQRLSRAAWEHGLQDVIKVRQEDFFSLDPSRIAHRTGLIVLNPPYGRRLDPETETSGFYDRIWAKLRLDFKGWRVALIRPQHAPNRPVPGNLASFDLDHGGLKVNLLMGKL